MKNTMSQEEKQTDEKQVEEIFSLLKQKGPLCASQISVELLLPLRTINSSLAELEKREVVVRRPEKDKLRKYSEEAVPWGLAIL